jgi:DDE_Tnp_1-associated
MNNFTSAKRSHSMHSTAFSLSPLAVSDTQRDGLLADGALRNVYQLFALVPDPRSCHGLRYDLPCLLTCLVAALLCNCNHSEAVGQWCQGHQSLLRHLFGPRRYLCPTGALYRWLLPQLDIGALETLLAKSGTSHPCGQAG